jgi:hypothetical protein
VGLRRHAHAWGHVGGHAHTKARKKWEETRARATHVAHGVIDVHAHLNEPGRKAWEGESWGLRISHMHWGKDVTYTPSSPSCQCPSAGPSLGSG